MKIYIELLFLENVIINYIILSETANISKKKVLKKHLLKSSLIGSFYACIGIIFKYTKTMSIILNIIICIVMIYITFKEKEIKKFFESIINYIYIFSLYSGLNFLVVNLLGIKNKGGMKALMYLITYITLRLLNERQEKCKKIKLTKENLIYNIEVFVKDKIFKYTAFVDTGNNAKDIKRNMNFVILENNNFCKTFLKVYNYPKEKIFIKTVSGEREVYSYIVDKIKFKIKNVEYVIEKVPVIFVENKLNNKNHFNSLIGYDMYLDYLGGIENE